MSRRFAGLLVIAISCALNSAPIGAQPPKGGQVLAMGTSTVQVVPTLLRLDVQLNAQADTAEKAVEKLKAQKKAALAKLKELKAEESSIRFTNTALSPYSAPSGYVPGPSTAPATFVPGAAPGYLPPTTEPPPFIPRPTPDSSPELRRYVPPSDPVPSTAYRMPLTETVAAGPARPPIEIEPRIATPPTATSPVAAPTPAPPSGTAPALEPGPAMVPTPPMAETAPPGPFWTPAPATFEKTITAVTTLRAEWRLATADPDAIALAGEALREKLVKAKIFGAGDSSRIMPMSTPVVPDGAIPSYPVTYVLGSNGGFTLSYVGTLTDADRKAAIAAALGKAKLRAVELAEAAGGRLEEPTMVSSDIGAYSMNQPTISIRPANAVMLPHSDDAETVGLTPNLPEFNVRVNVNFKLLPKNL